jgi:hypothetical protein
MFFIDPWDIFMYKYVSKIAFMIILHPINIIMAAAFWAIPTPDAPTRELAEQEPSQKICDKSPHGGEVKMPEKKTAAPKSTTIDLRGKQSVRATFKLSARAIDYLSLVAVHLGIKQKSLFDHLIDDAPALRDIAATIHMRQFNRIARVQKTYVLSRKTLEVLELISKDLNTPRDALVEYSLHKLEAVIQGEKKRHEQRKRLFKELMTHWEEGNILLKKAREILGDEDPFCLEMNRSMLSLTRTTKELSTFIEKSRVIEEY